MRVLVTGAAGFIGYHLSNQLLERGLEVIGIDNLNDYYDPSLKMARLQRLEASTQFEFYKQDLEDSEQLSEVFRKRQPQRVVNLAAQAGVRYSLRNPRAYIDANIVGFLNVLEACRHHAVEHLVYASSSSVYGGNEKLPFSVHDNVDHPLSLYAATKKANELMAHTYSHLYGVPTTGLRFFTVYGPWGRPDMALFLFTKAILEGRPIQVFNHGDMQRDFTYVDDIIEGVIRLLDAPPKGNEAWDPTKPDPATSRAPFHIYNIGNHDPVPLMDLISTLETCLGRTAEKQMMPMQPGDVAATYANVDDLIRDVGFKPATSIDVGVGRFVDWYREYYEA